MAIGSGDVLTNSRGPAEEWNWYNGPSPLHVPMPTYYHYRPIDGWATRYPSLYGSGKPIPTIKKCGGVDDEDNGEYIRYE